MSGPPFSFSPKSEAQLSTCHPDIQKVLREAITYWDFSVLKGHRGKEEQNAAFENGASQKRWPNSKHNSSPSLAVDVAPYPVDWGEAGNKESQLKARIRFAYLIGEIIGLAKARGIDLDAGADFNGDNDPTNDNFVDMPHLQLRLVQKQGVTK